MTQTAIILGARGRFGRAATTAFRAAGWQTLAVTRDGAAGSIACDAMDRNALIRACRGADVIVHALNPPYHHWARVLPVLTANVIAAARQTGATVMIPGNVYLYGPDAGLRWSESSATNPVSAKGRLRVEMEAQFRAAARDGVRSIVLRGGDFIERTQSGNWFDSVITKRADRGIVTYPGPLDRIHAWAYLPDMARAMAALAEKRADFAPFETFHFEGYSLTGAELIAAIAAHHGRPMKRERLPWPVIGLVGLVQPLMREVYRMRYLWKLPHSLNGSKLAAALPAFRPTPLAQAMADALDRSADRAPVPTTQPA